MWFLPGRTEAAGQAEWDKRRGRDAARHKRSNPPTGRPELWAQQWLFPLCATCVWKIWKRLSYHLPSPCSSCVSAFSSLPCVRLSSVPPRLRASRQVLRPRRRLWLRRSNVSCYSRSDLQMAPFVNSAVCGSPERFCRTSESVCEPWVLPLEHWYESRSGEALAACGRGLERDGNFLDLQCQSCVDWA